MKSPTWMLIVMVLSAPAAAEQGGTAFFTRSSLGAGYGHYFYPDGLSSQAGRQGGGPVFSLIGEIGVRFASGFILAGVFSFEPIVPMHSVSPRGTQYPGEFGPAGVFGATLGMAFERVTLGLTVALGGGGNSHAGGFGLYLAPNVAFTVLKSGRNHLQIYLRPVYGFLGSSPGISMYASAGGGVAFGWQ